MVGEEAAALCMNFMVKSLEDIDFGALPGVLAPLDILRIVRVCTGGIAEKSSYRGRGTPVVLKTLKGVNDSPERQMKTYLIVRLLLEIRLSA